jgi:hypothetical protein
MPDFYDPVELFWESLLSRDPDQIKAAWNTIDHATQKQVLLHLQDMVEGEDWHPEQRASAEAALKVIKGK